MGDPTTRKSRPIGSMIGIAFGLLWALIGIQGIQADLRLKADIVAAGLAVVFFVLAWVSRSNSQVGAMFRRRAYLLAVAFEIAAIAAASILLPRFGLGAYFLEAVGVIVGLHFIGLWKATGLSRFLIVAAGMCIVSIAAAIVPETSVSHVTDLRFAALGFGNALVLWLISVGSQRSAH